jgi:hypothetical protein
MNIIMNLYMHIYHEGYEGVEESSHAYPLRMKGILHLRIGIRGWIFVDIRSPPNSLGHKWLSKYEP